MPSLFGETPSSSASLLLHLLLQVVSLILLADLFGRSARLIGQPRVMGEMVAGILLGPSCFGFIAPHAFSYLFAASTLLPLSILSQIGLVLLMFQIGLEFDFHHLRLKKNRRAVGLICLLGIGFPALLGAGFGWVSQAVFSPRIPGLTYGLFLAVALCITAMPVLGRIMLELKMTRTQVGVLAITCAAFNDVLGWILLAVATSLAQASLSLAFGLFRLLALGCFLGLTWFFLRPVLRYLAHRVALRNQGTALGLIVIMLFLSAGLTLGLGLHLIFGGFWIGVLLHQEEAFVLWWRTRLAAWITWGFAPIFFTFTGLRTYLPGLNTPALWLWCALLIALATFGKFGGCWLAARWAGLPPAESRCLGILMNTRGLLELVVAHVGYELKIIPASLFTMLVLMALLTTFFTTPCLRRWLPATSPPVVPGLESPPGNLQIADAPAAVPGSGD